MVLNTRKTALLVAICFVMGCLGQTQRVKLEQRTPVAAAWLLQYPDRPEIDDVPAVVIERAHASLAERNIQAKLIETSTFVQKFEKRRGTDARLRELQKARPDAPFVMLVETEVRFYSYISGKFRWDVAGKVSFVRASDPEDVSSTPFNVAAFLDFDHQDEDDALAYLETTIASEVGRAADRYFTNLEDVNVSIAVARAAGVGVTDEDGNTGEDEVTEVPEWPEPFAADDAVYFIMVDRFANGDPSNDGENVDTSDPQAFHGGDIQGIIQNLEHLEKLGVKTLWLSPIFEMRDTKFHGHGAFHGYWIEDFGRVEPRFGTAEDLDRLVAELEKRDMRLLLDVVLNHVGPETSLLQEKPRWFRGKGGITDWSDTTQIETYDVHGLPDLDQDNEEVYAHLYGHSSDWIKKLQPSGFRLDAVKHISASFWQRYNSDIYELAGRDFVMLGEQLDGNPAVVAKTVHEGHFNAVFDFPLHFAMVDVFCKDASPARLGAILSADRLYPERIKNGRRSGLVTLLDNHDLSRILSACGGETESVLDAMEFMMTARGTPSFTWGTEIGMKGAKEPANRKSMTFGKTHEMGTGMREMLARRAQMKSLHAGRDLVLRASDNVFAYVRVHPEDAHLVALNRGTESVRLELPSELGGSPVYAATGLTVIPLDTPGRTTLWKRLAEAPRSVEVPVVVAGVPSNATKMVMVGSGPEIGLWSPGDAFELEKTDEGVWEGTLQAPASVVLGFKFHATTPSGEAWESRTNRFVHVTDGAAVRAEFDRTQGN